MKFLCESCKAKYQIADEKVAGRTVRMKCRKCGHLIEIRASVTEASVSKKVPVAVHDAVEAKETAPTPSPAIALGGKAGDQAAPAAKAGAAKAAAPAPMGKKPLGPAPKAGTAGTSPLRIAGGTAAKAGAPKAGPGPRPGGLAGAFEKVVKDDKEYIADEPTRMVDGRTLDMSSPSSTEEWYVGVNGVPVGPVRLAELRSKAASGAVTEDSLVWREGFEEWLPLRTFPELVSLVRSVQGGTERLSAAPPPPSAKVGLSTATSQRASTPPPRTGNVIPFSRAATAEKIEPAPQTAIADPFAAPAPAPLAAVAPPPSNDVPMSPAVAAAEAPPRVSILPGVGGRRAGAIPPMAWVAILLAMVTGVVAGSVLFQKPPPPPTVQIVTVAAPTSQPPGASSVAAASTNGAVEVQPDPSAPAARPIAGHPGTGPAPRHDDNAAAAASVPAIAAIPAIGGPSLGPGPGGPTPGGTADKLTSADLERVINNGRASLKRACWEPALAAKSANAPSTARVAVALTIGPDGHVQSAVPSGGEAFPSLGPCIAGRIRNWVFPPAATSTSTTAAFNFVAQ